MKHHMLMKKIIKQLSEFKAEVDKISLEYAAEREVHEKQLKDMTGKYTPTFIEESRRKWKPETDYAEKINAVRKEHEVPAMTYFGKIKTEIDQYFQTPVESGFVNTLTAVKMLDVRLKSQEFEVLQGAAGGYWGLRLLQELAISRTSTGQGVKIEGGQPKSVSQEKPTPYVGVKLPKIEDVYKSLQSVKNALETAFSYYCGANYVLQDFIFSLNEERVEIERRIEKAYGVKTQEQTPKKSAVEISQMAYATKCVDDEHEVYLNFLKVMDEVAATMPKAKEKTYLTQKEKNLIDMLINVKYPTVAKQDAVKLAKSDEYLAELLKLDSRYRSVILEALEEEENE